MASFDASVDAGAWGAWPSSARRALAVGSRCLLVALFALFAWSNFSHWRATGEPSGLGVTLVEGWAAALFLTRRSPHELSVRPLAWIAAPIGSFAMLLARPAGGGLPHGVCEALQLAGLLVALASLGTLGRSFGIVAANRGIKTGGPYRLVRHPTYLGYLISYLGYVAENPSAANVALLVLSTTFQLVRIGEEERLLSADPAYESYRRSVRFRLVPLLY